MKCPACGEENVTNAKFCAFCGKKLAFAADEDAPAAAAVRDAAPYSVTERRHMPVINEEVAARRQAAYEKPEKDDAPNAAEAPEPAPKAEPVFLFDDEKEERDKREKTLAAEKATARRRIEQQRRGDPFYGEEEETDEDDVYDDDYDDDDGPSRGRTIAMAAISIVTVVALIAFGVIFVFKTGAGQRLRASYGFAASYNDYYELGQWHKSNGNYTDAAEAYHHAFLLNQNDFDFALKIGREFEACGALEKAEQMYLYLIDKFPARDEPYDYLMALLMREGKTDAYNGLLELRAKNQPGYKAPAYQAASQPAMPQISPQSGGFTGTVSITLAAEDGAEIYFSLDGTDPDERAQRYTGPIKLYTGNYTLRAVAIRDGARSEVLKATYSVS